MDGGSPRSVPKIKARSCSPLSVTIWMCNRRETASLLARMNRHDSTLIRRERLTLVVVLCHCSSLARRPDGCRSLKIRPWHGPGRETTEYYDVDGGFDIILNVWRELVTAKWRRYCSDSRCAEGQPQPMPLDDETCDATLFGCASAITAHIHATYAP